MNILAIDTSTDVASIALWSEGTVVWTREIASQKTHSSALFPALEEVRDCVDSIDQIVVGLGPGSYAGIRIAIAAAVGLQCVWNCDLVGIPSGLAMAPLGSSFQVIGDARRGTWYYARIENGYCVDGPRLLERVDSLREVLNGRPEPVISTEVLPDEWDAAVHLPNAFVLAELAAKGLGIVQRGDLEPFYLREPHITYPPPKA